jgi:hypothetical protein
MVTLPSHTSHALQPLDVTFFKPFNNVLEKERYSTMERNHYLELDKVTLNEWVDKALLQFMKKKNN